MDKLYYRYPGPIPIGVYLGEELNWQNRDCRFRLLSAQAFASDDNRQNQSPNPNEPISR
jgi:hypothetical protein